MRIKSNSGTVTIAGQTFSGDVCVGEDGTITVNGAVVGKQASQEISVVVTGYVERLELGAGSVTVSGNADSIETMSGAVYCQDVGLDVETMSGSVNCRDVGGSVSTMSGSIKHRAPGSDIDRAALAQQPAPAAPVVREPVAFVSQETFSSDGTSDILTRNLPIGTALYAAPPAAEQAPRELFTCIGKGGRYELLGHSSGAGCCRGEGRVIYRCLDTGQLYHRTDDDFAARMTPLNEEGKA